MIHALDQSGLASLSVYSFCSISQLTVFVDSLLLITNCAAAAAVCCATGNTGGSVPVVTVRESVITVSHIVLLKQGEQLGTGT